MSRELPISVIVPVYNEGANIAAFLNSLESSVDNRHEVLIIYDFDKDDTLPAAKIVRKKYRNIKLIKNNLGAGLINACKTGIKKVKGAFVVIMPGDLADDPKTINKMYQLAKRGNDIICATRYSKGGKQNGGKFIKTMLSRIAGLSTPLILGISTTDVTNGYKMYSKAVLNQIKIESKGGWEFAMEILIKANLLGFRIAETPSTWKERSSGKSKFKLFKWLPRYVYWYFWGVIQRVKLAFKSLILSSIE